MKFKVGDIIKGKEKNGYGETNDDMTKGKVIRIINNKDMEIKILEHKYKSCVGNEWTVDNSDKKFELVYNRKPTKEDLFDMPVGTKIYTDAEDKEYQVWLKTLDNEFINEDNDSISKYDVNKDLTFDDVDSDFGTKIIKIEEPTYEKVYDYSTEIQEMTVAEIEKELGHAIKIIKEDS